MHLAVRIELKKGFDWLFEISFEILKLSTCEVMKLVVGKTNVTFSIYFKYAIKYGSYLMFKILIIPIQLHLLKIMIYLYII